MTMKLLNQVFFGVIGLMMALAAAAQFFLFVEFGNQCGTTDITTAPATAGACLAGSFVFNGAWVAAKRSGRKTMERASILLWTMFVVVGVAAAGGVLGQAFLAEAACGVAIETAVPVLTVQYTSIALLLLSISVPHAMKKEDLRGNGASAAGGPLLNGELTQQRPLVFI